MHGRIAFIDTCLGKFLDEGRGLSTSANTVGGIENVVVGLRYGIFELMNFALVPYATRYNITKVLAGGHWKPVNEYIPPSHRLSFPQRFARLITSPWDSIIYLAKVALDSR